MKGINCCPGWRLQCITRTDACAVAQQFIRLQLDLENEMSLRQLWVFSFFFILVIATMWYHTKGWCQCEHIGKDGLAKVQESEIRPNKLLIGRWVGRSPSTPMTTVPAHLPLLSLIAAMILRVLSQTVSDAGHEPIWPIWHSIKHTFHLFRAHVIWLDRRGQNLAALSSAFEKGKSITGYHANYPLGIHSHRLHSA